MTALSPYQPPGTSHAVFTAALTYQAHGLAVIPAALNSKRAAVRWRYWCDIPQQREDVTRMFGELPESNVAVLCGPASGNLVVVDCESRVAFNQTRRAFEAEGVDTWVIETSRGGHFYVRTANPLRPAKTTDGLVEVRSGNQYVLAPPSRHPSGAVYHFISQPENIAQVEPDQLAFLGLNLTIATPSPHIPASTIHLLRGRNFAYSSRSEQEQAIVQGLVNVGFPFKRVLSVFQFFPAAGKFREIDRRDADRAAQWLQHNYEKARGLGDSPTVRRIMAMRDAVARVPWPGRTGITDRRVLLSHLSIAARVGSMTYEASQREIAEATTATRETVSASNNRLMKAGFIKLVSRATTFTANQFTLVEKKVNSVHSCETTTCEGMVGTDSFFVPEALATRVLGRAAPEVFRLLQRGQMTASGLTERSGRSLKAVRKALKAMSQIVDRSTGEVFSLVEKQGKEWSVVPNPDLLAIARALGTEGFRKRMNTRHERERMVHRFRVEIGFVGVKNMN